MHLSNSGMPEGCLKLHFLLWEGEQSSWPRTCGLPSVLVRRLQEARCPQGSCLLRQVDSAAPGACFFFPPFPLQMKPRKQKPFRSWLQSWAFGSLPRTKPLKKLSLFSKRWSCFTTWWWILHRQVSLEKQQVWNGDGNPSGRFQLCVAQLYQL